MKSYTAMKFIFRKIGKRVYSWMKQEKKDFTMISWKNYWTKNKGNKKHLADKR